MKEKTLHELPEKRDRYTKHFQTGDKGRVAAIYPRPVHFEKDGQWQEIDNRLELKTEDGKEYYGNRASALQVRFAREAGKGSLVILKKDGHEISWDLAGAPDALAEREGVPGKQKDDAVKRRPFKVREKEPPSGSHKGPKEKKMEAVHLISEGDYEDILPGVDLSYHLNGEGLKENITFKTKEAAMQEIVFQVRHKGLGLKLLNDGTSAYGLFDKKREGPVCTFALPYMYDASGHICMDVELKAEAGKDMSILKVVPDKDWLQSEDRIYPVVIDPMVETAGNKQNIYDAFVKQRDPAATRNYHYFRVGYESSTYGACRGFLKFRELPAIGDGSIVTRAYMNIYQYGYDCWNADAKIPITAHGVNANWDPAAITWNTQPPVSDEVLDVKEIGNVVSGNTISFTPVTFDVTKLIRSWYNTGNNHGICLKSMYEVPQNNDHKSCGKFFASDYPLTGAQYQITEDMYPCGIIEYRCVTGLEGYQSYHEQDLGHSGKGYTNDYTGNVVWTFTDAAAKSGILPASLGHVYNLADRNVKTCCGWGWRLTAQQELKTTGIEKYPYVYKDADGTEHYFYKDDEDKLKDEDGLGLTITQESSSSSTEYYRIMETKDGMKYSFASDGYLRKIEDPDGNAQTYTYTGGKLTKITDGALEEITLSYSAAGQLEKASYEKDKDITYEYDEAGSLLWVHHPDGRSDKYYCDEHRRLRSLKNHDGRKISYHYTDDFAVPRVSRVVQTGSDNDENGGGGTTGRVLDISYVNGNTTIFTECGLDGDIADTADNRTYTYHFDDMGRPSCIVMDDGRAADYGYYTEGMKNHKLMKEGKSQATTYNLLRNPNLSQDFIINHAWQDHIIPQGTSGSSIVRGRNPLFGDAPANGREFWKEAGLDHIKAVSDGTAQKTGIIQRIQLPAGTYTFSGRASVTSRGNGGSPDGGACLMVLLDETAGSYTYSSILTDVSDTDVDHGWETLSVTFTTDGTKEIGMIAGIREAQAEAYFAGLMLEQGDTMSRQNLICNGRFTNITGSIPAAWTYDASDASVRYKTDSEKGTCACLIGEHTKNKKLYQQFNCYGEKGDVYFLSGWAKGCGIPEGVFKMSVDVIHTDDTEKTYDFPFERNITDWQFQSGMLRTEKDYRAVRVSLHYDRQCNEALFKGIQLVRDDGESYVYDEKGNLTSAVSAASSGQFMHGAKDTLTRMTDISGSAFEYGYDEKKHVVSARNSQGVQYHFSYNGKGLPEKTLVLGGKRRRAFAEGRTYHLREKISGNYLQAGDPSVPANAQKAVLMTYTGDAAQKWKITDAGEGQLRISPVGDPDKALEVKEGLDEDYTDVLIAAFSSEDKQKWQLHPMADGSYEISCKCTSNKRGLSNAGAEKAPGHVIQNRGLDEGWDNQHWFLEPVEEGLAVSDEPKAGHVFGIRVRHSGNYIHVPDGNSGTACQAARSLGNEHQMFLLEDAGNGYFYIRSILHEASGKEAQVTPMVLSATSAGQVVLKEKDTADNGMKFKFTAATAGQTYRITDKNDKVIRVPDASYDNNKALISTAQGSGRDEQWILEDLGERIVSSVSYDNKGKVKNVTDSRGNVSTNEYDEETNLLIWTQDGKGNKIHYGYDASERITSVSDTVNSSVADAVTVTYGYEGEYLKDISHNGFSYTFDHDVFGNRTAVKVKNGDHEQTLMTTAYRNANGPVHSQTYGNGDGIRYEYDKQERVTGIYKTNGGTEVKASEHVYDKNGVLICHKDLENDIESRYQYDLAGRITGLTKEQTGGKDLTLRTGYDDKDRVSAHTQKLTGSAAVKNSYRYGEAENGEEPGLIYGMSVNGTEREVLTYDGLGRVVKKTIVLDNGAKWETEYTYVKGGLAGSTTLLVESVKDKDKTLFYTYDEVGNIVKVEEMVSGSTSKVQKASYTYDHLGQLIREDNGWTDETALYTYDKGGNMLKKDVYEYTTNEITSAMSPKDTAVYSYEKPNVTVIWKDQLLSYKGQDISYDDAGNPLNYRGSILAWKDGRKLSTYEKNGVTASYTYDQNGDRIKKMVGNNVTKFHTDGGKILIMEKDGKEVHFLYDQDGSLFGMKVMSGSSVADYYYEKNLQGDIVGVIDSTGNRIVSYKYDSWGRPVATEGSMAATIGVLNPFRYRGYFYDEETGWYYLKSRYYDPEVGRFINADAVNVLTVEQNSFIQFNIYVYCLNNPINYKDSKGYLAAAVIGGAIAGAILSTVSYGISCAINNEKMTTEDLLINMATGAASGAIGGVLAGASLGAIVLGSIGVGIGVGAITYASSGDSNDAFWAGLGATTSTFVGTRLPSVKGDYFTELLDGFVSSIKMGFPFEMGTIAIQNSSISFATEIKKPVSSYLGGSTKKSCGPYRRGWTQVLYKRSRPRMRSASYFYKNIIY